MVTTTYTIQMASKISGVGVHTIRAWEKRYKALDPSRDASGHRTYSKSDVEKLMLLSELCLLGYTISKVAGMSIAELKELLLDLGKTQESLEAQDFNLVNDTKLTVDSSQSLPILIFALKSYKVDIISLELGKLKTLLSSRDFIMQILTPLSTLLDELEGSGTYTEAQSETLKAIFKFHMGYHLYHPAEKKDKNAVNIVLGGLKGDTKSLALNFVGVLCHFYGFHYTYLGSDLSYEALADAAKSLEANVVIVSANSSYEIEKLIGKLGLDIEIIVSGKMDLDLEKIPSKRLVHLKTLDAVDGYLLTKNN